MLNAREYARLRNLVLAVSMAAWLVLLRPTPATSLSFAAVRAAAAAWVVQCTDAPGPASWQTLLTTHPPTALAANWALMLVAMMGPLLVAPIAYLQAHCLARRRARTTALFVTTYGAVWLAVGAGLLTAELTAHWLAPGSWALAAGAALAALVWQASPLKQRFLNRCHRHRPLAAFGRRADIDALRLGLEHGLWCAGSCWAAMLVPLLLPHGHLPAMAGVGLLMFCERLDPPGTPRWQWRGFATALRYLRLRLRGPRRSPFPVPVPGRP